MDDESFASRVQKRIRVAKKKIRPDLYSEESWTLFNYANNFQEYMECTDNCDRINQREMSEDDFIRKYENCGQPVVITGAQKSWKANWNWTPKKLMIKYGNQKFNCGDDSGGYNSVEMKMKYYVNYMLNTKDDSPLSIFDCKFAGHSRMKKLLEDYEVPYYFSDDLFKHSSNDGYPYRWFSMGPARSGRGLHVELSKGCTWNALVYGHKRWCLFPPETPQNLLALPVIGNSKQHQEAITWFTLMYPRTKMSSWPEHCEPIEILQKPGETVFVPDNWWQVALNLDTTIGITQKFYTSRAFDRAGFNGTPYGCPMFSRRQLLRLRNTGIEVPDSAWRISEWGCAWEYPSGSNSSFSAPSSASDSTCTDAF